MYMTEAPRILHFSAFIEKCSIIDGSVLFESVDESGDMVYNYTQALCVTMDHLP